MQPSTAATDFERSTREFESRAIELGLGDPSRFYWYHAVDLGNGLITPGIYDFRFHLDCFGFPADMRGLRVLDAGSATGFFAFEFERRGAHAVSVEVPSLDALDRFPGQTLEQSIRKIERMMGGSRGYSAEQLYEFLLTGPFEFCRNALGSRVERCFSSIYALSAANLGTFDLIFLGDVLLHTRNPLEALAAIAPLCKNRLILSQVMPGAPGDAPSMAWVGGEDPVADEICWWLPNQACLIQILKKLGFRDVRQTGVNRGTLRPSGYPFERPVLHAVR
jgi:tRNA (mo5U34)-methyltransferase